MAEVSNSEFGTVGAQKLTMFSADRCVRSNGANLYGSAGFLGQGQIAKCKFVEDAARLWLICYPSNAFDSNLQFQSEVLDFVIG